jgi:outer membrane usher protein
MPVPLNSRSTLFPFHESTDDPCRWFVFLGVLLLAIVALPLRAEVPDQTLLLDVHINGHSIGLTGEFTLRGSTLLARRSELHDLGLRVPLTLLSRDTDPADADPLILLSDLPGMTWTLDSKTQALFLKAGIKLLLPTRLQLDDRERISSDTTAIQSGTGVSLNYDVAGNFGELGAGGTGALDFRAFSPLGVLSSGWLAFSGANRPASAGSPFLRLDSTYSFADTATLRRYSLGDFITGGLTWTRPIRMLGAQIRSDFSMRPDLVTFPLPSVGGEVAVPSTVDVLADGNVVVAQDVNPGPFEIPQLPVVSGAGTITLAVTNDLGQQVRVSQPYYASATLLAPGLQTFSGQAGLVRRNWGQISNDYGKLAGTFQYRRGLTQNFTFEGTMEDTAGLALAGAGAVRQIGHLGVGNLAVSGSASSQGNGLMVAAGAQRVGRTFSLAASATVASRLYQDVAAKNGQAFPRKQIAASGGLSLRRLGSIGGAYGRFDQDASANPIAYAINSAEHTRIVSANYSVSIHHMSIYANEFHSMSNHGSNGLQFGVIMPFGRRSSVSVGGAADGSGQVQAQQSATRIGEWGYQAYESFGGTNHQFEPGQYKSPWGLLTAGVDMAGSSATVRLEDQGAISFVDRGLFPSNTIYDSFAIVDTGHLAHVSVLQENRPVGQTDGSGRLLVPDMHAFSINQLSIKPENIPPDISIDTATREIRPQDRSGVVVKFRVKVSHGALLRLIDDKGAQLPVGSIATLRATGTSVPVGFEGEAYVEELSLHNELSVEIVGGKFCTARFDYNAIAGEIPTIGPLRCVERRP